MDEKLRETINYLVNQSIKLKNKYTSEANTPIEFGCIFCQSEDEYKQLTELIEKQGQVIQDTPSGYTYFLNQPIETNAGPLRLIKIRKSDTERQERGDTDFNTNYQEFKEKYQNNPHFALIQREDFEMLRLSDPEFDVMVCFSSIPLSRSLNIEI